MADTAENSKRTDEEVTAAIDAAVANARRADGLTASAAKRGSNPNFPYIPIITHTDDTGRRRTQNPRVRRAFATREEAVAFAQNYIDHKYRLLAERLRQPNDRALREHHGLPRELDSPHGWNRLSDREEVTQ